VRICTSKSNFLNILFVFFLFLLVFPLSLRQCVLWRLNHRLSMKSLAIVSASCTLWLTTKFECGSFRGNYTSQQYPGLAPDFERDVCDCMAYRHGRCVQPVRASGQPESTGSAKVQMRFIDHPLAFLRGILY